MIHTPPPVWDDVGAPGDRGRATKTTKHNDNDRERTAGCTAVV